MPAVDGVVNVKSERPYMIYLQGGPGFQVDVLSYKEIAKTIHEAGYQTLWLDARGTGLSTPVSGELFQGKSDEEIASYLKHFRADSIVRDCEAIRKSLLGLESKWSLLGQSYGGCCSMTYLSLFPNALKEAFLTGGLVTLADKPDVVYEKILDRVFQRNRIYYCKYPKDVHRVRRIVDYLASNEVTLPNGGKLTPGRWQQLGIDFGAKDGIDRVHQLVLRANNDLDCFGQLSYWLLHSVENRQDVDTNPIYAILHEAIYCQGHASNWAAHRVIKNHDDFFQWVVVKAKGTDAPLYFYGEMIFPDMFDDYSNLRPLKGAAHILAQNDQWGRLYDLDQLAKNTVPVTAATYVDDMYVDFGLAQETAGSIGNLEQYITNQYFHSGLRNDPEYILGKLFEIAKRERN